MVFLSCTRPLDAAPDDLFLGTSASEHSCIEGNDLLSSHRLESASLTALQSEVLHLLHLLPQRLPRRRAA